MKTQRPYPSVEELKDKLRYDDGQLFWRHPHPMRPDIDITKPVGNPISKKRPYLSLNWGKAGQRRRLLVHRVIWMVVKGYEPDTIDHINNVHSDNRIENLRDVTQIENLRAMPAHGAIKLKGVTFHKATGRYRSMLARGGVFKYLGYFDTPEEAHAAWLLAAKEG